MPIVIDPSKEQLLTIDLMYIEIEKKRGNTVFHFIHSAQELEEWQSKGYVSLQDATADTPLSKQIQNLTTYWRTIRWKDQNAIFSRSVRQLKKPDGTISAEVDPLQYRDLKLKTCLKKWSVRDENGNEIPVTEEAIDRLDPVVAHELLLAFEGVTEVSEEDLQ